MKSSDLRLVVLVDDKLSKSQIKKEDLDEVTVTVFRGGKTYYRKQWVRRPNPKQEESKTENTKSLESQNDSKGRKGLKLTISASSPAKLKEQLDTKHIIHSDTKLMFFYKVFSKLKKDKVKALEYLEKCGVKWDKSSDPETNWERACKSAEKYNKEE